MRSRDIVRGIKVPEQAVFMTYFTVESRINDKAGWESGREYVVNVLKLWNKRFAIFKTPQHWQEPSGYKVYDKIEDIWEDFEKREKTLMKFIVNPTGKEDDREDE